jgi:hypothetical protein
MAGLLCEEDGCATGEEMFNSILTVGAPLPGFGVFKGFRAEAWGLGGSFSYLVFIPPFSLSFYLL